MYGNVQVRFLRGKKPKGFLPTYQPIGGVEMLVEQTLFGDKNKVDIAIDRLRYFEPLEGYYLCFSGGKDSQTIYHLAKEAGVKFDAHYNVTGIDPPELVYFIRDNYKDVHFDMYEKSMWRLIETKGLPMRQKRFCCSELKEHGGEGRICVTGIRWAESTKRKNRKTFEIVTNKFKDRKLFNDNDDDRMLFENCSQKGKRVINPVIDFEDLDVWSYLNLGGLNHCCLYDQGCKRIGCIGCPMASMKSRIDDFKRYPKFYDSYLRAVKKHLEYRRLKGLPLKDNWKNAEDIMHWWIYGNPNLNNFNEQLQLIQ